MSELFLVRHAQASFGTGDYDRLSDLGHRQACWLGEYFRYRGLDFDRVICGEMVRHRETAEGIADGLGRGPSEPELDPAWNEFDFEAIFTAYLKQFPEEEPSSKPSMRSFSRILRNALQAWAEDRLEAALPERWHQFEERIDQALLSLLERPDAGGRVLLVSSGGPISMALRQVLEAPASAMVHMNLQLRNSSFSHLFFSTRQMHFSAFNHTPHLEHPDRSGSITYY